MSTGNEPQEVPSNPEDLHASAAGRSDELLSRAELLRRGAVGGVAAMSVTGWLGAAGASASTSKAESRSSTFRRKAKPATLVVLEPEIPPGFDMEGPNASNPGTQEASENLNEYLVYFPSRPSNGVDVPNFRALQGRLAQSWERNGLEWTFHLRKGVRSAAGNEFTADDVIWNWQRGKSVTGAVPDIWFVSWVGGIKTFTQAITAKGASPAIKKLGSEVRKIDKYTVRFTQSGPDELFPIILSNNGAPILDATALKQHATQSDPWVHQWLDTQGVAGFGAYALDKWVKGSSISLTANPHYYRGQPQFTSVTVNKVPESSTRLAAILGGSADVVTDLTPQEFDKVAKSSNAKVLQWNGNRFLAIAANYKTDPWSAGGDAKKARLLRQALAFAMPYQEVIAQGFFGRARQWNGLISSTFVDAKRFPGRYRTDVNRAKSLLAQAGYANGKGLEGPGMSLSYVAERQSTLEPIVTVIQTGLAKAGIKIELNPIPNAEFTNRTIARHDLPLYILDTDIAVTPDAGYMMALFYASHKAGALNNNTNYANSAFDRLFLEQKHELGAKRRATLGKAQDILMSDLPFVPIVERPTLVAVRKEINGWGPLIDQGMTYRTFTTNG